MKRGTWNKMIILLINRLTGSETILEFIGLEDAGLEVESIWTQKIRFHVFYIEDTEPETIQKCRDKLSRFSKLFMVKDRTINYKDRVTKLKKNKKIFFWLTVISIVSFVMPMIPTVINTLAYVTYIFNRIYYYNYRLEIKAIERGAEQDEQENN